MSILDAMQSAAVRLVARRPSTFFGTTNPFEMEIAELATEVGKDIAKSHDWQALTKIATINGTGEQTAFTLPNDYDRMLVKSDILDTQNWAWGYHRIKDMNEWLRQTAAGWNPLPGGWILFGNEFQFVPAPKSGATAKYPYVSKNFATDTSGTPKASFTKDDDKFVLDERLMTLGLIWKWREQKRLDASGDEANFLKAFDEVAGKDKGSNVIALGRQRYHAELAYPYPLGQ